MVKSMMSFRKRLWTGISITLLLALILTYFVFEAQSALLATTFFTGWILFVILLILSFYNVRKKLTFLPIGSSSVWLQIHIYLGLLMVAVFFLHTGWGWPHGAMEQVLEAMYLAMAASGLLGLLISRTMPSRLRVHGEEIIFERIPIFRKQIADAAVAKVIWAGNNNHTTIVEFYQSELATFFQKPRNILWHLVQSRRPIYRLLDKLEALDRYMNREEREIADSVRELVEAKNNLDHHYSLQLALKGWLFLHIPLTYALLLFALVHGIVVYAFFHR
jgi:hypothetical protein